MTTRRAGLVSGAAATAGFSAQTGDLTHFVEAGHRHVTALQEIATRIADHRRLLLAELGVRVPPARAAVAFERLIERVGQTTDHVRSVRDALLAESAIGLAPVLGQAVLAGRVPPPDDRVRDRVLAALESGQGPEEAGIDPVYFPAAYLRHRQLSDRIADAEARREEADGRTWSWWDEDAAALAAIDEELARLRDRRDRLSDGAIGDGGEVSRFDAAAMIGATTGGADWEGQVYGSAFVDHHDSRISDGGLFGLGRGELRPPDGFESELTHLARRVAADSAVALAFYNRLGLGVTADLPSFVVGSGADRATLARLGRGLARASRSPTPQGRPALAFGGGQLIEHPRRAGQGGVVGYSPALLFLDGSFDAQFLADATTAALRLADAGDPRGFESHWGLDVVGGMTQVGITFDGGEDPRNILLGRAATSPATTRAVLTDLAGRSLDPLLRPEQPFGPTIGTDPHGHWLDGLTDAGNVSRPDHGDLSPLAYPDLPDPYPITGFLGAVAADDELASWVLSAVASASAEGSVVRDAGTAAGLDLILAHHATVMFDPVDLARVGLEPTGLGAGSGAASASSTGPTIQPAQWRAVHQEVLDHGRGQALAARLDDLLDGSIDGAIDADGRFNAELTRPFAHMAGPSGAEADEALVAYAADLDDEARRRNRWANRSASIATTTLGFVPGAGLVAGSLSVGWSWFFDGYPVDAELRTLRRLHDEQARRDPVASWGQTIVHSSLEARLSNTAGSGGATVELRLPDGAVERVELARNPVAGQNPFRWQDPRSGRWSALPATDEGEFQELFRNTGGQPTDLWVAFSDSVIVGENYRDGLIASDADREAVLAVLAAEGKEGETIDAVEQRWDDAIRDARWTEGWLGGTSAYG